MIKNFFTVAWRNMLKNKIYSFINIGGLAVGMTVAMLIGLWIYDELNFNKSHANYDRIAQVMQHQTFNGKVGSQVANPAVMGEAIRASHGSDFTYVVQSSWTNTQTLTYGDKMFLKTGNYMEPEAADMLSLKMIYGNRNGLRQMNNILLSQSVAEAYFGKVDPVGKTLRVDDQVDVKVAGVYEDFPANSNFHDVTYLMPWELYLSQNPYIGKMENPWGSNFTQTFAMLAPHADFEKVSQKIKDVKYNKLPADERRYRPVVFLHPMSKWHLYADFENGVNTGGGIQTVWMFGIIGLFVLLLACINFMNLSTARSEKRAKEVGIRKAVGSVRKQLIAQFFSEAIMISLIAFLFSLFFVLLILPFFNTVADKQMTLPWNNPLFWLAGFAFSIFTGLVAGIYPAIFLSSFQPVKVLKGTFRAGRFAAIPRQVLVVTQFAISIILIIGTIVVYKQINHAQDRPIGYTKIGLVSVRSADELHKHFDAIRTELKQAGAIMEMTQSTSPATGVWNTNGGFDWEGKDPDQAVDFPNNGVTYEYGKTLGWKVVKGRDFSREFRSDTAAFILNESAVKFMGFDDPIGKILKWEGNPFVIVGVVEDILVQSPYKPVRASLFYVSNERQNHIIIRVNPNKGMQSSLQTIEKVFKKYNPERPFEVAFVDEEFAEKFGNEKRIGKLASFFAILAILISCLGLFGLASFVAEQRTREIGIRKVLGASVSGLWQLLSKDFIVLVFISCAIAIPAAYYFMYEWLKQFDYRTAMPWWIFVAACLGALIITLLTVSFQAIRAALANPVKSLRTE